MRPRSIMGRITHIEVHLVEHAVCLEDDVHIVQAGDLKEYMVS